MLGDFIYGNIIRYYLIKLGNNQGYVKNMNVQELTRMPFKRKHKMEPLSEIDYFL